MEFFQDIKNDFGILVDHLVQLHGAIVVDVSLVGLYHEDKLNLENKNFAEIKDFNIVNKVIL